MSEGDCGDAGQADAIADHRGGASPDKDEREGANQFGKELGRDTGEHC